MPQHPALRPRSAFPSGQIHESVHPSAAVGLLTLIIVVALSATNPGMYFNLPGLSCWAAPARALHRLPAVRGGARVQLVRTVFRNDQHDQQRDIDELVNMAQLWMNTDVHKVEQELKKVSNPFLRTGVQLIIDNTPEDQIIELLQCGRAARARTGRGADVPRHGHLRPGLRHAGHAGGPDQPMAILGDGSMQTIGQQLAIGLMTTFYGILLANLVQAHRGQAGAPHRPPRRIHEHGAARHRHVRSAARPSRETLNSFVMHVEDEIDGGAPPRSRPGPRPGQGRRPSRVHRPPRRRAPMSLISLAQRIEQARQAQLRAQKAAENSGWR